MSLISTAAYAQITQNSEDKEFSTELSDPVPFLIRSALLQHPALRSQVALSDAAESAIEGAKWQFWPTPSVGVEYANTSDSRFQGDATVATLRLQQPIWTGGRLTGNLSRAEAESISTQADVEATKQQLALRVIQSWSDAVTAHNKLIAFEQSRAVHSRLLSMVERRAIEGASAKADVDLARSRLDAVEADLAATRAQRDIAIDKLNLITGISISLGQIDANSRNLPPVSDKSVDALMDEARDQSPQIAKSRAQAKIAEADISIAKSTMSPEVYLRAERQYGNFNLPDQDPENRIFIGVSTAFGGGLSVLSAIDAAEAKQRSALEDIKSQQLAVDEQVQSDALLMRTALERRKNLEQARQSAVDVSASWERQFLAGRKQWQDLMNSAREQTQTETQLADAIGAQLIASWRLLVLTEGVSATIERQAVDPTSAPYSDTSTQLSTQTLPLMQTHIDDPESLSPQEDACPEVYNTVKDWAASWSAKDVAGYLSHYAVNFLPASGLNRSNWESLRKKRISSAYGIKVGVSNLKIQSCTASSAKINFRQVYRSTGYRDETDKTLTLVREGSAWKIQREMEIKAAPMRADAGGFYPRVER